MTAIATVLRRRLLIGGVVQGVGFRPFVHRLANEIGVSGFVGNDAGGVFVEIEGPAHRLDRFLDRLQGEAPPLATIERVEVVEASPSGATGFVIVESRSGRPNTLVPPDVAMCDDCAADLADPSDRRHRHPFTNCTNCGPRFTIIRRLPYDRAATTMAGFAMCDLCRDEYENPTDRRYHAQPVACPSCGPRLHFERDDGAVAAGEAALVAAQTAFARGEIVAVKGLGGFHLACDAHDDAAIARLRERKGRGDKPLAVMVRDLAVAETIAHVDAAESELLASPARPIVLLRRRADASLSPAVAPRNPLVGIMLPYTPLHELLFARAPGDDATPPTALVMTSGNRSGEPIAYRDDDAPGRLDPIADGFLLHDRPIAFACDDSVMRIVDGRPQPIRRSRGYAPLPVTLPFDVPETLAVGGELKNTFCIAAGRHAWVSQHIGDMENLETLETFSETVDAFTGLYDVDPTAVAADRHPAYLTRRWALERAERRSLVEVQHHHAHVASLMVEHGLDGSAPIIGVAFDGTGHGEAADGSPQIWGGEVLVADYTGFERIGHLSPMPLPGGDAGVRNPCRIAVAYLSAAGIELDPAIPSVAACDDSELRIVVRQVERDVGCVPTTSMGRLFDVVSSMLGIRHRISYEAQAAIELEAAAIEGDPEAVGMDFAHRNGRLDPAPLLRSIVEAQRRGAALTDLASGFHAAVARGVVAVARRARDASELTTVGLTGGVFQNALLSTWCREALEAEGFEVLTHELVPANDGGLSLGQAVVAGALTTKDPA